MSGRLTELIAKVEVLAEPDREVDADLLCISVPQAQELLPHWDEDARANIIPPYTASLDAAVALAERVLPNANRTIRKRYRTTEGRIDGHKFDAHVTGGDVCESFNEATALVLALLRALEGSRSDG